MDLKQNIFKKCEEKKIPVRELERRAGISQGTINKWGSHEPGVGKVALVAGVLGTSIEELIGESAWAG